MKTINEVLTRRYNSWYYTLMGRVTAYALHQRTF